MRFTFLVALLLIATPALADPAILTGDVTKVRDGAPITGVPRIVDGDSLVIGGVPKRKWPIIQKMETANDPPTEDTHVAGRVTSATHP